MAIDFTSVASITDRSRARVLAPQAGTSAWVLWEEKGSWVVDNKIQRGASAEADAAQLLAAAGYRIVERNFRCKAGELDVIARDGDVLVFVEVRSRTDDEHGSAVEMIRGTKQRRVVRVAACYLELMAPDFEECRFDIVAITAGEAILLKDAFRAR